MTYGNLTNEPPFLTVDAPSPDTPPTLRYAVLHHTGVPSPHFDVLIEPRPGAPLASWRAPTWPVGLDTAVERISDHRPLYLDFEGEVHGNRGRVARVSGGTCRVEIDARGIWTVTPTDATPFAIQPIRGGHWQISPA